jgi:exopolysaccharide production protein ExoQ
MTANTHLLPAPAAPIALEQRRPLHILPAIVGFVFAFRTCLTFLWFQAEPQQGTAVNIALSLTLLTFAAFCSIGSTSSIPAACFRNKTIKAIVAFQTLALISITWSAAQPLAAAGYWTSWAANVATVWLILRYRPPTAQFDAILKGAVWGASLVALIAWSIPAMPDLRLGDIDFLHPNALGFLFAITALMAMYLARHNKLWRWPALWLATTLFRTLSKTSIIAFAAAVLFYLVRDSTLTRATKIKIGLTASLILASLWGIVEAYLNTYTRGTDPETLTGRTLIWAASAEYAVKHPWLGNGFYSYRWVVPAFGPFEAWTAHNELLQQFFSFGVVGVIVVIALYWAFFRQIRCAPASHLKTLASTLLIFALVRGLTDTENFDLSFPLWLMTMLSILLCPAPPAPATVTAAPASP